MRFSKISFLYEGVNLIFKKINELPPIQQNIYRVVDIKYTPIGQCKLVIQVIGKSTVIECTPHEIVANDCILEGFSKKDIRNIIYFACEYNKIPRYKIIMQEFCNNFNKIVYKLKKNDSNEVFSKTAHQISLDKNIISNLSKEDACSISC